MFTASSMIKFAFLLRRKMLKQVSDKAIIYLENFRKKFEFCGNAKLSCRPLIHTLKYFSKAAANLQRYLPLHLAQNTRDSDTNSSDIKLVKYQTCKIPVPNLSDATLFRQFRT
jgi:hypothetical protein